MTFIFAFPFSELPSLAGTVPRYGWACLPPAETRRAILSVMTYLVASLADDQRGTARARGFEKAMRLLAPGPSPVDHCCNVIAGLEVTGGCACLLICQVWSLKLDHSVSL